MHGAAGALEVQAPRSYISGPAPARVGALLAENCAQKNQKLFLLDKITFRFANGNFLMRTAVFLYNIVCVCRFSMCVSLDIHDEACLPY